MITQKVILLLLALQVPYTEGVDDEVQYRPGFAVGQVSSMEECRNQQAIIEYDFRALRHKESQMKKGDIEPRLRLVQSDCMVMPIQLDLKPVGEKL